MSFETFVKLPATGGAMASSPPFATEKARCDWIRRWLTACLCGLAAVCLVTGGVVEAATRDDVLKRMEAAGGKVTNFSTAINQKKWTAILKEFGREETGTLWYLRTKEGAYLRRDIVSPGNNVLVIANGEVILYEPRIKQAQKYELGNKKDKAEFLILGFGPANRSLSDTYHIDLLGEEKIDGKTTYMLQLRPKSERAAAYFSQIVLWVAEELWLPIQQKLVEPNGDYLLIKFSHLKLNPGVDKNKFKLKLPKGVQVG